MPRSMKVKVHWRRSWENTPCSSHKKVFGPVLKKRVWISWVRAGQSMRAMDALSRTLVPFLRAPARYKSLLEPAGRA